MRAYLSACFAMRGKISEISIPGTLVLIGLLGPRISAGASGLGVPSIELRRTAYEHQKDAVNVLLTFVYSSKSLQVEKLGKTEAQES